MQGRKAKGYPKGYKQKIFIEAIEKGLIKSTNPATDINGYSTSDIEEIIKTGGK
jgi:uncharacterized protein YvpB